MFKILGIAGSALSGLQGVAHDMGGNASVERWTGVAQQDSGYVVTLTAPLNMGIDNMYAGHRSHSSHSSHRSHSSHYSGSGGTYRAPAATPAPYVAPQPVYTPPPRPAAAPARLAPTTSPATTPSNPYSTSPQLLSPAPTLRPTADQLMLMIMRVQAALYSKGYDPGAIDGTMSPQTKAALTTYQKAHGLAATGTMTTDTLNSLGVALQR